MNGEHGDCASQHRVWCR